MLVYRLCNPEFSDDLTGEGSFLYGGRWNFKGERMLYTSTNASLSLLETLVHLPPPPIQVSLSLLTIEVRLSSVLDCAVGDLPPNWKDSPVSYQTRDFGSEFLQNGVYPGMMVPSVLMPKDKNLLIHPGHPGIELIQILSKEEFSPENRLLA
jgi:RES domain-containing protein